MTTTTGPRLASTDWTRLATYNLPYAPPAPKALRAPRLNKAAKPAPRVWRTLRSTRPAAA